MVWVILVFFMRMDWCEYGLILCHLQAYLRNRGKWKSLRAFRSGQEPSAPGADGCTCSLRALSFVRVNRSLPVLD